MIICLTGVDGSINAGDYIAMVMMTMTATMMATTTMTLMIAEMVFTPSAIGEDVVNVLKILHVFDVVAVACLSFHRVART